MHVDRLARLRPPEASTSTALADAPSTSRPTMVPAGGKPAILAPPPLVAKVIEDGVVERRMLFPEAGGTRVVERWNPPTLQDGRALEAVRDHLSHLEAVLEPADRGALLARILALLSHFRAEANPPQVEQMMADDWAEDLGAYPIWAVEEACRRWRRTRKWRPQICEMLALCAEAVGSASERRDRLRSIVGASEAARNPLTERMRGVAARTFHRIEA